MRVDVVETVKGFSTGILSFAMVMMCLFCPGASRAETYGLKDLYRIALERSERVKMAEENLSLAEAGKDKKRSLLMPRLTAYGSYTDYTEKKYTPEGRTARGDVIPPSLIQPENVGTWGVRLDQSITLNGREIRDFNVARDNLVKQRSDIRAQKEEYLMTVALAYYETLRARKALDIADAQLERLTTYRNAAEKRLKVGEVTKTILLRADGELSGARSERIKAKNALDLARAVLARIVGIGEDFQLREDLQQELPLGPLDAFLAVAANERPEIKSAEQERKMAEDTIKVAMGGYWPTLSIAGVYGRMDQDPYAGSLNRESIYAQASLNFPFFEGGLRVAEVREAKIREKQAELKLADLKKQIRIEVETAYLELSSQRGIIKALEDQLVFARDNYNAVARQFEFGLANSIDVMDANTLLVSTERQLAAAVYTHQIMLTRMKRAMGILLKEVE
ncbi:MAG: TolC family protein [Syntrophales bacterium]|nr:TolC family protein [Syntrophales bacterium]